MNNQNSIDIIIPVKERNELLNNAIKSISKQTLLPKKVFVIDDCSVEKIEISKVYPFEIEIIRNIINKGPSFACNLGVKKSNAKYLAILETDDLWTPEKLEKQFLLAEKNNLDFIYCNYFLGEKKNIQEFSNDKTKLFDLLLNLWSCPNPSTFFFKKDSFLKLGGFDEEMMGTHDHDFWIRLVNSNLNIDFVNDFLVIIEDYNPNQMSRDYKTRIKSINFFLSKHENLIIEKKGIKYFKKYKNELLARALIPSLKKIINERNFISIVHVMSYLVFSKLFYFRVLHLMRSKFIRFKKKFI